MVKLLQRLPRLRELSLIVNKWRKGFDHVVNYVAKLHNLRKLSIEFIYGLYGGVKVSRPTLNSVAMIIAANPNLTHLELSYDDIGDLAQMLQHVPADRPLKLEHLRLGHSFRNSAALAPHISSLTSIDLHNSKILKGLLRQKIFPPTMTFRMMDRCTIKYLDRHPRIVSLTNHGYSDDSSYPTLLGILSRHSKTLTHLGLCQSVFFDCINQTQNELALLQCTNLKQLALDYPDWCMAVQPVLEPQMVSLTRSGHPCHVLNITSIGNSVVSNFSPSGLSHTGCQQRLGLCSV